MSRTAEDDKGGEEEGRRCEWMKDVKNVEVRGVLVTHGVEALAIPGM
jgi:hypothetical protein